MIFTVGAPELAQLVQSWDGVSESSDIPRYMADAILAVHELGRRRAMRELLTALDPVQTPLSYQDISTGVLGGAGWATQGSGGGLAYPVAVESVHVETLEATNNWVRTAVFAQPTAGPTGGYKKCLFASDNVPIKMETLSAHYFYFSPDFISPARRLLLPAGWEVVVEAYGIGITTQPVTARMAYLPLHADGEPLISP